MLLGSRGEHLPAMQSTLPMPGYVRLFRGDDLVGESGNSQIRGSFIVPQDSNEYRLEAFQVCNTRFCGASNPTAHVEWTFASGHEEEAQPLPLMTVGYLPALDEYNRAPAGRRFTFPVRVEHQPRSTERRADLWSGNLWQRIRDLEVERPFHDGSTWQDVRVVRLGKYGLVTVENPATGYVAPPSDGHRSGRKQASADAPPRVRCRALTTV